MALSKEKSHESNSPKSKDPSDQPTFMFGGKQIQGLKKQVASPFQMLTSTNKLKQTLESQQQKLQQ